MSLRRKWVLTMVALLGAGALLSISANVFLLYEGARMGASAWFRAVYEDGIPALHAQMISKLRRDAQVLQDLPQLVEFAAGGAGSELAEAVTSVWRLHDPNEFWITLDDRGRIASNEPACHLAGDSLATSLAAGSAGIVMCGGQPVLVAPALNVGSREVTFFAGYRLDATYADAVRTATNTEITLIGPSGDPLVSTFRAVSGERVLPGLAAIPHGSERWFGTARLELPTPYAGYAFSDEPLDAGNRSVDSFVLAGALAGPGSTLPMKVLLSVPRSFMEQSAYFATMGMLAVALLVTSLLCVAAWRMAGTLLRPLENLTMAVRRVSGGDRDVRVPPGGPAELDELGRSFNAMVERLEESRARGLQSEKMAAIGQLAGGVAHEINNPLGVILGFAQGMERRVPEGDALRLPVASIVRESLRCKALVQELLTFSRTARSGEELVDLGDAVRGSAALLESRAKTQDVSLDVELDPEAGGVRGNRTQIQQIVVNLGTNALDATPRGGRVSIRTRRLGESIRLEVADTGLGIPQDIQARIFEPFFTTKEPGKGTGLGLSLVWEIVNRHRGIVRVESAPGGGTKMVVEIPAAASVAGA